MLKKIKLNREIWGWAFYDWACSAFATSVMVAFFPIFFKQYWATGGGANESTFKWGLANSIASTFLAFLSPFLGALADQGRAKMKLLTFFILLGVFATGGLFWVGKGEWAWAMGFFILASIGYAGANTFYDALLMTVAKKETFHFVSAFGFSLGYMGGGLLLILNLAWSMQPHFFGFENAGQAVRFSFLSVAIWWFVFSIPIWLWVHEKGPVPQKPSLKVLISSSLRQVQKTFGQLKQIRGAFVFLLAYFFYIDGVSTVMKMSTDYGLTLGFTTQNLILSLVLVQLIGIPAALGFGQLARVIGARRALDIGIFTYMLAIIWGYFISSTWEFYVLAGMIGLVQGGVQSLSRSVFAQLIPAEQSGEFFGFYNMLGKFSTTMGPLLVGAISLQTGNARLSLLSILILFAIGWVLLHRVPLQERQP